MRLRGAAAARWGVCVRLRVAETAVYAAALRTSDEIRLPIGARTETNLRNSHLGYAITWYGIACALIGVYLAFHHQAGRLTFGAAGRGKGS